MSNGERELLVKVEKKLKDLDVYITMSVGELGELMGIFLLTQKKNKEAFTSDDVEYLIKLQPQMTGAIANAIFYKQAVERIGRM